MSQFRRRQFLRAAGALLVAPIVAQAQRATTPYRIGVLTTEPQRILQQSLRDLGYVESRDVVFETRNTEGRSELLDEFALDLVRLKVDVIVANNPAAVLSAKRATATIPIVMVAVGDPVRVGLISNLGRPGGNITGFTNLTGQLAAKRLQLLKELLPTVTRVGVIGNPGDPNALIQIQDAEVAARELKLQLRVFAVGEAAQLEPAFEAARSWRAQALIRLADPTQASLLARTIELAARTRMPVKWFTPTGSSE